MKLVLIHIFTSTKSITFLVVLFSMMLQTVTVTINTFNDNDTEFTIMDMEEEDADEEEKTQSSNEKTEPPIHSNYDPYFGYDRLITCYLASQKLANISVEIPIPPPEYI